MPKPLLQDVVDKLRRVFRKGFVVASGDVEFNGAGSVTLNNDGSLTLNGVATSDPHINGRVWVDGNAGNAVKLSQG